jgi:exosortase/archaeosortase family protein
MSSARKKAARSSREASPKSQDPAARAERRRVMLRFLLVFVGLLVVFQLGFELWLANSSIFETYLHWNAAGSAAILRVMGEAANALGTSLESSRAALGIRRGCDAIQPCAIFVAGILAFPASAKAKSIGLAIGVPLLLAVNLLRIITLYFARIHAPDSFETIHEAVWPAAFVLLAVVLWMGWILRTLPRPSRPAESAV